MNRDAASRLAAALSVAAAPLLRSPAGPAAVLLYGILFGFAAVSYLQAPWESSYTLALYAGVSAWAGIVILSRLRSWGPHFNHIDFLFAAFLLLVLASATIHWWPGTKKYLAYMPVFFVLPYLLGRVMRDSDVLTFMKLLFGMGTVLLLLMPVEYLRNDLPVNRPSPLLFSQGHGAMLSGLLFGPMFLVVILRLLGSSNNPNRAAAARHDVYLLSMLALVVIATGWISARGSALCAVLATGLLFVLSPCSRGRKGAVLLVFVLSVLAAAINPLKNPNSGQYYGAVVSRPSILLDATASKGNLPTADTDEFRGKPVLGEKACKSITDSVSDRWIHYQTALAIFSWKPLTGVGANHYGFYSCTGPGSYPHSTALQVLAELGLVGIFTYSLLILAAVLAIARRYRTAAAPPPKSLAAWLLAYLVFQALTGQFYGDYFMSAALYFALGVAGSLADGGGVSADKA